MAIEAKVNSGNFGFAFGGLQEMAVDNGCGFFVSQKQSTQLQMNPFDQSQSMHRRKNPCGSSGDQQLMAFSEQIEKQRLEIDQFMALESEKLRLTVQEQRRQQIQLIIKKYESKTKLLLAQKDEEIARAAKRTIELRTFMKKMEIENQTWQLAAKENEAIAVSLNLTIERLKETARPPSNAAEDAESCCQNIDEQKTGNGIHNYANKMVCRCCNSRNSCVIMLPCRHLCSCKDCDAFLHSCPVCRVIKTGSIEASI